MDDRQIADFVEDLHDAGQFAGPGTAEAVATSTLLRLRRADAVDDWVAAAVTTLRDAMREDYPPPVARVVLQTPTAVLASEAESCCPTEWMVDLLRDRAKALPDVWVALAVPHTSSQGVHIADWNPMNTGDGVTVHAMRWFIEVRGRRMGLRDGKLVRTGWADLDHRPIDLRGRDDPALLRLGRRLLRGHPMRRR